MEVLLTLPALFAQYIRKHKKLFPEITAVFSDPEGTKLGSGGGTANVLAPTYLPPVAPSLPPQLNPPTAAISSVRNVPQA